MLVSPIADFPWKARKVGCRFVNLSGEPRPRLRDILSWRLTRNIPPDSFVPPVAPPDLDAIQSPDPTRITVTWVGHATFLLQLGGRNFLTDPLFGQYCGPVPARALRRHGPPGLTIDQLPAIDAILVSHCHYDHLDRKSLMSIRSRRHKGRHGTNVLSVICPTGVGPLLRRWGMPTVTEMSWGDAGDFDSEGHPIRITCLPAQHGAARTTFDRDATLWCGWLLQHRGRKVAFLGDSGYGPFFAGLGERFGSLDLALIPIGAYHPRSLMRTLHMTPEEAVSVHRDLRSSRSIAMHWGTFALADDPLAEAPQLLAAARKVASLTEQDFSVLRIGETVLI